ncbi:hypothetical protein NMY22_g12609 [Coprinellus aureogranulatus]|nr:hypothetical protein NMY22_g12609 [Coprinellus aureogranulatus]
MWWNADRRLNLISVRFLMICGAKRHNATRPFLTGATLSVSATQPSKRRGRRQTQTKYSVVCRVKLSANGRYLATGSNHETRIYDAQSGMKVCVLVDEDSLMGKSEDNYIRSMCFSPCGRWLATGADDRVVRVWDIARQKVAKVLDGHQAEVYALQFSLDGKVLVSGSGDKTVRVWDVSAFSSSSDPSSGIEFEMQVDDRGVRPTVLTIEDCAKMDGVEGPGGSGMDQVEAREQGDPSSSATDPGVASIAVSPDGRYVAAGTVDSVIHLWDLRPETQPQGLGKAPQQPRMVERLKGHKDSVYDVAFTRDGRFLVSASLDKGVRVWDVAHLGIVPAPGSSSPSSASPRASSSETGSMSVNGVSKGMKSRCVTQFVGHRDFVLCAAVSSDGKWVVSGSKDRGVMWWEVPEHESDSTKLAAEGAGERAKEKEGLGGAMKPPAPEDREAVCLLQGHTNSVISVDLAGSFLATGSGDWKARIFQPWGWTADVPSFSV